jgi:hypothetical protein
VSVSAESVIGRNGTWWRAAMQRFATVFKGRYLA